MDGRSQKIQAFFAAIFSDKRRTITITGSAENGLQPIARRAQHLLLLLRGEGHC
jgi:hypothetical protein